MRIKRFTAPDMRTALRMIRDEQGPDAVILSNRVTEGGGIEVVSATDYDEALVAQALRAAAPAMPAAPAPVTPVAVDVPTPRARAVEAECTVPDSVAAAVAVLGHRRAGQPATRSNTAVAERESLMSRARAMFRSGDELQESPTLAELAAATMATSASTTSAAATSATMTAAARTAPAAVPASATTTAVNIPAPSHFEAMMAALLPAGDPDAAAAFLAPSLQAAITAPAAATSPTTLASSEAVETPAPSPAAVALRATAVPAQTAQVEAPAAEATPAPALRAVPDPAPADPAFAAMRDELAQMRVLMEAQMSQLSLERLRGSPARAAALEALAGFGCDDALAQAVASQLDPRLSPEDVRPAMFAELARMLTVARHEPIDDGGVIALIGPTGAGKTSVAARLAARFAARHRARDVALVTTNGDRAGAREQLQAYGRRLGITVCEASGPDGLQATLEQLEDYPLVLVDTAGHAPHDRALFRQFLWLRAAHPVRSLLVLPANAHPHDLGEVVRRYRPAAPEAVVLTKLDETGRPGSALSVAVQHGLNLAYVTHGQQVPADIEAADALRLVQGLEKSTRAADNPIVTKDCHAAV